MGIFKTIKNKKSTLIVDFFRQVVYLLHLEEPVFLPEQHLLDFVDLAELALLLHAFEALALEEVLFTSSIAASLLQLALFFLLKPNIFPSLFQGMPPCCIYCVKQL